MRKVVKLHRRCSNCGTILELYPKDIIRGKGLYCRDCVQKCRHITTYDLICQKCSNPFKSTNHNDKHCSIECKNESRS